MYEFIHERNVIKGKDIRGKTTVLFECLDIYKNKSRLPMHDVDKDASGRFVETDIFIETLLRRYENYIPLASSEDMAACVFAMEFMISDHLLSFSRPVMTALIDAGDDEINTLPVLMDLFDHKSRTCRISSEDHEIYQSGGFDMLFLRGNDLIAKRQLIAAYDLLSKDGLLFMIAEDTLLFDSMVKLFCADVERHEIGDRLTLYVVRGSGSFRAWFKPEDLETQYDRICSEMADCLAGEAPDRSPDKLQKLRDIASEISRLELEAVRQKDPDLKQTLIDLKETLLDHIV